MQAAPLEFSSLWACCVRFAVHSLSESGSDALGSLLDSISAPIGNGELSHLAKVVAYGHLRIPHSSCLKSHASRDLVFVINMLFASHCQLLLSPTLAVVHELQYGWPNGSAALR